MIHYLIPSFSSQPKQLVCVCSLLVLRRFYYMPQIKINWLVDATRFLAFPTVFLFHGGYGLHLKHVIGGQIWHQHFLINFQCFGGL
jgi:hypothetical protein